MGERLVTLLKDAYRGRRSAIGGGVVTAITLAKLAPILLFWPSAISTASILLIPFFLIGLAALVWGLFKWNNASSEIKAIKQVAGAKLPKAAARPALQPASSRALNTRGDLAQGNEAATDIDNKPKRA
jgi:hypothetical protein